MEEKEGGCLTNSQIVRLAAVISADKIGCVAEGYLDMEPETVTNLKSENVGNAEAFHRAIIRHWANRNPENQIQTLASILYSAACEHSYVDPQKVREILGVSAKYPVPSVNPNMMRAIPAVPAESVTRSEFLSLAQKLKPHTERAMKLQMVPWIKDYEVKMKDLYTNLILEKLEKEPNGVKSKRLKGYNELFGKEIKSEDNPRKKDNSRGSIICCWKGKEEQLAKMKITKRVLIKADPGMGKTTLMKKMGWDWARGVFTTFDLVFIIFLKLVKPGDSIENIIIDQTPELEGMKVTPQKLKDILEYFSDQVLVILDGLDEYAFGENQDVLKIIKGKKLLDCNVIVTSRPHSTKEVERFFHTIGRIDGFTRENAELFAVRIVKDSKKVQSVLNFNRAELREESSPHKSFREESPLHKCPILLSFMCLLVTEDNVDLSNTNISTGEIYFRMIRCLYKKYVIREEIEYQDDRFFEVLRKVGKLALQTLLSGNPVLKRSDVIRDVGEEAFEYGLLIGHEDFRLIRDETADIYVTFPHRSIQEFLGAFFFIAALNEGKTIESLLGSDCKEPIFMTNLLFRKYCLWFSDQKYVAFHNIDRVFETMKSYIKERINVLHLNFTNTVEIYASLDLRRHITQDELWFYAEDKLRLFYVALCIEDLNSHNDSTVREESIDLSSKAISTGEIYFRLIRCLYKMFVVREETEYQEDKFVKVLRKGGRLALETLSGNHMPKKSQADKDVGEEACDLRLLIEQKDFRLICNGTVDVFAIFPEQAIQEFLSAFYFSLMLSEGETIESLFGFDCKEPKFMMNSLFLRFFSWFINQKFVSLNDIKTLEMMKSYILELSNHVQSDLQVMAQAHKAVIELRRFRDILEPSDKIKHLVLKQDHPIDFILTSLQPVLKNLSSITVISVIENDTVGSMYCEKDFEVVLKGGFVTSSLHSILSHISSDIHPSIYLHTLNGIELSEMMHEKLQKLHIHRTQDMPNSHLSVLCQKEIKLCPSLTHLSVMLFELSKSKIDDNVFSALSKAMQDGKLPRLTHLSFAECGYGLKGKLHLLLQSPWPTLTHLNVRGCQLDKTDIEVLGSAHSDLLPKLESLMLDDSEQNITSLFNHKWTNLRSLSLRVNVTSIQVLTRSLEQGQLSQLTHLHLHSSGDCNSDDRSLTSLAISEEVLPYLESLTLQRSPFSFKIIAQTMTHRILHKLEFAGSRNITGKLSTLLCHSFPSLNSLILRDCGLNSQDLCSLAQARTKGRLPELRHLDISYNRAFVGILENLFDASCTWDQLLSLNIECWYVSKDERYLYSRDLKVLCSKVASGCLGSLQELSFRVYTECFNMKTAVCWPELCRLNVLFDVNKEQSFLSPVVEMVESGFFPALRVVQIKGDTNTSSDILYRLQKVGICVYGYRLRR